MTADRWRGLIGAFVGRKIDEAEFHDRFFDLWHDAMNECQDFPPAIETLFFVVEAYCPDERLRDPGSAYEASAPELRQAAETALAHLASNTR